MTNKQKVVICDLDGTLCNIDHRLRFVTHKPKNYHAFEMSCGEDGLNEAVALLLRGIEQTGTKIIFVSGRSDMARTQTESWLLHHGFTHDVLMRKSGDHRRDDIIKEEILREIEKDHEIIMAIDDRKQVVDMWKRNGIFVVDVRQTDKEY